MTSVSSQKAPLRLWDSFSAREASVWGAAYVASPEPGIAAARYADSVVQSLAKVPWPEASGMRTELPANKAARLVNYLTYEQFRGWYIVEVWINTPGRFPRPVEETEIQEEFKVYQMCSADYL